MEVFIDSSSLVLPHLLPLDISTGGVGLAPKAHQPTSKWASKAIIGLVCQEQCQLVPRTALGC